MLIPCVVVYNVPESALPKSPHVRSKRSFRRWLGWLMWLLVAVGAATVAQYWRSPTGHNWASLAWLMPVTVAVGLMFTALWDLLGSRRTVGPVRSGQKKRAQQRRPPRDPQVHLHDLRRSREYWAIMLRLPPDGACEAARALRWEVFDLYRAPALPLANCGGGRCRCGYSGLKERRRRDVLPAALDRDRRAGAVITYRPQIVLDRDPAQVRSSLAEMLSP